MVYNATSVMSSPSLTYCNVTVAYTHTGSSNIFSLMYGLKNSSSFKNRFCVGGGGGYSLKSDATGGLVYGAVSDVTHAGYDTCNYSFDEKACPHIWVPSPGRDEDCGKCHY